MEWHEFINNMRKELGLTIPQFSRLLGVSVETVQGWLYKKTIPIPFQQELLLQVHEKLPHIKAEIEMHKQQSQVPASANQESVWPYVLAGIGTVSAVYGLYKLLDLMFQKRSPQGPTLVCRNRCGAFTDGERFCCVSCAAAAVLGKRGAFAFLTALEEAGIVKILVDEEEFARRGDGAGLGYKNINWPHKR